MLILQQFDTRSNVRGQWLYTGLAGYTRYALDDYILWLRSDALALPYRSQWTPTGELLHSGVAFVRDQSNNLFLGVVVIQEVLPGCVRVAKRNFEAERHLPYMPLTPEAGPRRIRCG